MGSQQGEKGESGEVEGDDGGRHGVERAHLPLATRAGAADSRNRRLEVSWAGLFVACGVGVVAVSAVAASLSRAAWDAGPADASPVALASLLGAWTALAGLVLAALALGEMLARQRSVARWTLPFILAVSALSQAILVAAPPVLSDDLWRYVHDGRVVAAGRNPWAVPPADSALDPIAGPERPLVNHPTVRSPYPPGAQALFGVASILGVGAVGLKLIMAGAALALTGAVALLLPARRRHRCLAVGWHPLVVLEVGGSGHLDVLAVTLATVALVALVGGRGSHGAAGGRRLHGAAGGWRLHGAAGGRRLHGAAGWRRRRGVRGRRLRGVAAACLAVGALVKLLPAALAVALAPRLGAGRVAAVLLVTVAGVAPLVLVDAPPGEQAGLAAYAEHWDFNGAVYPLVRAAVEGLDVHAGLDALASRLGMEAWAFAGPQFVTRAILGIAFALVVLAAARRVRRGGWDELVQAALWTTGAFVLLSPTVHPWYLTWVLPFAVVRGSVAWLWLTLAVGLSYASAIAAAGGAWSELGWPRLLEYLPFVALLAWELMASSARAGAVPAIPSAALPGDDRDVP